MEIDAVVPGSQGHAVAERSPGQAASSASRKDIHARRGDARDGSERFDIRDRVLVRDDVDGSRELDIAADMIEVRMRVDEAGPSPGSSYRPP
jgi:hypothetical protein